MAGWVVLPVLPILAQSISYPSSIVPEHKTVLRQAGSWALQARGGPLLHCCQLWGVPGKGPRQLEFRAVLNNMATSGSLCMKIM